MRDTELVHVIAELIRRALVGEYRHRERPSWIIVPPGDDIGLCTCEPGQNKCTREMLAFAFQLYTKAHPERFW